MLKAVLLASAIIFVPGIALAQVAVAEPVAVANSDRVSFSVGAADSYLFERLAFEVEGPVVNAGVTYEVNENFSVNLWGQYGNDRLSQEIDLTGTGKTTIAGVDVSVTAGGYFYPTDGSDTIYTVAGAAYVPMGPVVLELQADHYMGGFENTTFSAAIAGSVGPVNITVGKAFNTDGIDPVFARISVPVGPEDLGIRAGARFYTGEGEEGLVFELNRSF
ncbi:MAG: hypothetical protein V4682_01100 [Patescibacteria group bacterium]